MQQRLPSEDYSPRTLVRRLDRTLGELNVLLLTVAIGLATLDLTCFLVLKAAAQVMRAQLGVQ